MDCINNEILLSSAGNVAVLQYDADQKTWSEAGGYPAAGGLSGVEGVVPSAVFLLADPVCSSARIVARRQSTNQEVIANCYIGPGLQYKRPTARFFEWRDSRSSSIYGFNFYSDADADHFVSSMYGLISKLGKNIKEQQQQRSSTTCGSLENVKSTKLDTLPPPGKNMAGSPYGTVKMPSGDKGQPGKRGSFDPAPCQLPPPLNNNNLQSRPLPPVPQGEEGAIASPRASTAWLNSLIKQKKPPPPPATAERSEYGRSVILSPRPKTLLPPLLSPEQPPMNLLSSPSGGNHPSPPPPPPPPPPQTAPVLSAPAFSSAPPATIPVAKTKRSQSVGLLDAISAVQLKTLQTPAEGTSSKEGTYCDMMSEISARIRKRKEKENQQLQESSCSHPQQQQQQQQQASVKSSPSLCADAEFKATPRPQSAKSSKIPPPAQLPGRTLKRSQLSESFTCGQNSLPSVSEVTAVNGGDAVMEKIESLKKDIEKLKVDVYGKLEQMKNDIISAIKSELVHR